MQLNAIYTTVIPSLSNSWTDERALSFPSSGILSVP